jgi:hypothetical protein
MPPVPHYVAHVRRMGLNGPSPQTEDPKPEPRSEARAETDTVRTASRPPRLRVPHGDSDRPDASHARSELDRKFKAIEDEIRSFEAAKSR